MTIVHSCEYAPIDRSRVRVKTYRHTIESHYIRYFDACDLFDDGLQFCFCAKFVFVIIRNMKMIILKCAFIGVECMMSLCKTISNIISVYTDYWAKKPAYLKDEKSCSVLGYIYYI